MSMQSRWRNRRDPSGMTTIAAPSPALTPAPPPAAELQYGSRTSPLPLRLTLWILLGITLFGGVLRFSGLDRLPLWFDEAATYSFASKPLGELWGEASKAEPNPPLYYTLHHLWLSIGHSERSIRALPALIGTLTIPLACLLGASVAGRRAGLVAAALLATSPIHLQYSQEARAYVLLIAAAALAAWGWIEMLKRADAAHGTDRRLLAAWIAYVVGNALALYAHNTAVLLTAITGGYALVWWCTRRFGDWRVFSLWASAAVGILALWGWWLPILLMQAGEVDANWHMPQPTPKIVVAELERVYGQVHGWYLRPLADAAVAVLIGLGLWRWRRQPERLLPLVVLVVGLPVLTLAMSLYRPMYLTRTLLWPLTAWLVLLACGLWSVRSARLRGILVGVVLAVQLWGVARYYAAFDKDEPWDRLIQTIAAEQRPGDVILVQPAGVLWPLAYYGDRLDVELPGYGVFGKGVAEGEPLLLHTEPLAREEDAVVRPELAPVLPEAKRVWLIVRNAGRRGAVVPALEAMGFREVRGEQFEKIRLRLLDRTPPPAEAAKVR